ncbi:hypothetical protein PVL29_005437 [Vitis rotundifolia]|uniref:CW-type domain-containing protein n=1 Tax=Vitis rotundifolia TaxID=103349 RepID=A0AA39E110_VITRO|nr:hypothetical protein PVL29_005437 [Vitis rotundifolia]
MIQPAQLLSPEASSHTNQTRRYMQPSTTSKNVCINSRPVSPLGEIVVPSCFTAKEFADRSDAYKTGRCSANSVDRCPHNKFTQDTGDHNASDFETQMYTRSQLSAVKQDGHSEKNYVRADPSYLKTLGQAHSGWIFGAIAELVDNSRDAKATKLDISIEMIYSKKAGEDIPMLSVKDDGQGMTHKEIVRMVSFGHKQPDTDDPDHIGRFGIGFKNLEIPIVSYYRQGQFMELDESVQSEAFAKYNLKAIKEFSPFNKYSIGTKAGLFCEKGTGTQIYIWNLDKWGSDYCLEWHNGMSSGSSFYQGDVFIRSRRVKSRPGQISQKVPLDYSLRSYLEVIFLNPRMKIFIQGSLVKSRPLAKSLNNTVIENGIVMGKPVQLTLGRCQLEWEQANCGIFLYWHGRLIEGYKRVGGMIHNADMGRGVIGVIDVTDIMNDGNGHVWVHSNKQGFQDCEPYARLEEWLGSKADEFWDTNFDTLQLKKGNNLYKPDHEWVQCDKCRKWRVLSSGFRANDLPQEWFCYMEPFIGLCETPEQKVARGVITVSAKRFGCDPSQKPVQHDNGQFLHSTSSLESSLLRIFYLRPLTSQPGVHVVIHLLGKGEWKIRPYLTCT